MLGIIYLLNSEEYEKSLKSFLTQLNDECKLVIINRIMSDTIDDFLKEYHKENIKLLDTENRSLKDCIELGLKNIDTNYINVTSSNVVIKENSINEILKGLEEANSGIFYVNSRKKSKNKIYYAPRLGENPNTNNDNEFINLNDSIISSTSIFSYIFKREKLNCINDIIDLCDSETSIQILLQASKNEKEIYVIKNALIINPKRLFLQHDLYSKDWYTRTIEKIYIPFAKENKLSNFQQRIMYSSIFDKIYNNRNGINKEVLLGNERDEFFDAITKLFKYFDDSFFNFLDDLDYVNKQNYGYKYLMLYLKEKRKHYSIHNDEFGLYSIYNAYKTYLKSNTIKINAINYMNNILTIDAHFEYIQLYDYKKDSIRAFVNDKEIDIVKTDIYSLTKHLSKATSKKYTFKINIPIDEKEIKVEFILDLDGQRKILPVKFTKPGSRLSNTYPNSYWCYKGISVKYINDKLVIQKNNFFRHLKNELLFYKDLIVYSKSSFKFKAVFLRTLYWILKPFYSHKRIWLYFDKLYKADDNGEFAIAYSSKLNDNISHYYVLNRDSYDYPRLKKEGIPLLKFNSLRHKLMTLYAENIVATHPDIMRMCGFGKNLGKAFRGLYNANIICIAHGLTMQKNAEVQNRLYDNTMFYTTSSKYEVQHLLKPVYGYSKDQIALTGMARFDVMISNDQREILITPTWRRSISGKSSFYSPKGYNEDFKQSSYYKIYNSLINDKDLIECAKEHNYKIIFLLHPAMSAQIDDYDKNDYVEFLQATSDICYHDILSKSSLMVTDYSGVQYDFAYMHKPIIYYHHKLLPPRFEEGALKYDTMGFGEICTTHEQIVNLLIKYMKNDCKLEEKYEKRINDFFAFNDTNNGRRIYEAILKFSNERLTI